MSDTTIPATPAPGFDFEAYMASQTAFQERASSLVGGNKEVLFAALTAAGITHVTVEFDGCSDSGQIESITAYRDNQTVELPGVEITISSASWGDPGFVAQAMTVEQAIERMAYDFLAGTHGGWENNDGAWGEFCFDARAETIQLDFNERFTSSEYYAHAF
ncbi:hypothetical protein HOY34_07640 [Xinfangfangia sp. D13-10-4-6]|uniref:DUF6878 family protein n=1 Tax=Pseudogemmobacter hezensis TaxID=2737662 RepID=UPI0015538886|nr:DUF6878 family protein [Pseudogemmobacter hezensis]NPD15074.1 hypothetical protein [Pseudogemmobacter hezensis]